MAVILQVLLIKAMQITMNLVFLFVCLFLKALAIQKKSEFASISTNFLNMNPVPNIPHFFLPPCQVICDCCNIGTKGKD